MQFDSEGYDTQTVSTYVCSYPPSQMMLIKVCGLQLTPTYPANTKLYTSFIHEQALRHQQQRK